jgi:hypothetical protein
MHPLAEALPGDRCDEDERWAKGSSLLSGWCPVVEFLKTNFV